MDALTKKMIEDLDYVIKKAKAIIENVFEIKSHANALDTIRTTTYTKVSVLDIMSKIEDLSESDEDATDSS